MGPTEHLDIFDEVVIPPIIERYRKDSLVEKLVELTDGRLQFFEASVPDSFDADDLRSLGWSLDLMYHVHAEDRRVNGDTYIQHPLHVSYLVMDLFEPESSELPSVTLLHDTVEKTEDPGLEQYIREHHGAETGDLVRGLMTDPAAPELPRELRENYPARVAKNVGYFKAYTESIRDDRILLMKSVDSYDSMHLEEIDDTKRISFLPDMPDVDEENFRLQLANKHHPLIGLIQDALDKVDADILDVSQDGIKTLQGLIEDKRDEVVKYAGRWEHDKKQLDAYKRFSDAHNYLPTARAR